MKSILIASFTTVLLTSTSCKFFVPSSDLADDSEASCTPDRLSDLQKRIEALSSSASKVDNLDTSSVALTGESDLERRTRVNALLSKYTVANPQFSEYGAVRTAFIQKASYASISEKVDKLCVNYAAEKTDVTKSADLMPDELSSQKSRLATECKNEFSQLFSFSKTESSIDKKDELDSKEPSDSAKAKDQLAKLNEEYSLCLAQVKKKNENNLAPLDEVSSRAQCTEAGGVFSVQNFYSQGDACSCNNGRKLDFKTSPNLKCFDTTEQRDCEAGVNKVWDSKSKSCSCSSGTSNQFGAKRSSEINSLSIRQMNCVKVDTKKPTTNGSEDEFASMFGDGAALPTSASKPSASSKLVGCSASGFKYQECCNKDNYWQICAEKYWNGVCKSAYIKKDNQGKELMCK